MPAVLHILTRFTRGGLERNVLHYINWERSAGYDVHLAFGPQTLADGLPTWAICHPIPSLVRAPHPLKDLRAFFDLRRLIESMRFDIVHTHHSKAGVIGRLAARGRTPALVHTIHMSSFGPGYSPVASQAFLRAERLCGGFTDAFVTVGEELRQAYLRERVGSASRYAVIRTPIEVDRYLAVRDASPQMRMDARRKFARVSGDEVRVIASIGTLEPRKRQGLVFDRLAPLLREGSAVLVVAGDGPERRRLEKRAARLQITENVRFVGFIDDVDQLLLASDLLASTAVAEGTPQVVVQALAAGRPVVATEVCGLREVTGATVSIVDMRGESFLDAVRSALRSPSATPPLAAFESWRESMVEQQIASLHQRLSAIGKSGAAGR